MKLHETCTCGAGLEIEHDDPVVCLETLKNWHDGHVCKINPREASASSITGGSSYERFGFGIVDELDQAKGK